VQVRKGGQTHSATFPTKASAQEWATKVESEINAGRLGKLPDKTFADLVDRYLKEVTPTKRGSRQEAFRLARAMDDDLGDVSLDALGPEHVAAWRDRRLKAVSGASVNREWNTLSNVCQVAVREWRWLKASPFTTVKRPKNPEPRSRVITDAERDRILLVCGDNYSTVRGRVGAAFLFALETAMRAGEVCALTWGNVHTDHVHLPMTKNGTTRDVPLSAKAVEILDKLRPQNPHPICFGITAVSLDATFRKIKVKALCPDIVFHDTRRTALTHLAGIFTNPLELARISGHRDLRVLMNVYFSPSVSDLAKRLETPAPSPSATASSAPQEVQEESPRSDLRGQ
jgi:integrase